MLDAAGVQIICALKGFFHFPCFPLVKKSTFAGATASSLHEAKLVFEEMHTKAHTYCPVYVPQEFDEIQAISSHISFNSLSQYEQYKDKLNATISYGIRKNPGYSEITTDLYNPASPKFRLGIPEAYWAISCPIVLKGYIFMRYENTLTYLRAF